MKRNIDKILKNLLEDFKKPDETYDYHKVLLTSLEHHDSLFTLALQSDSFIKVIADNHNAILQKAVSLRRFNIIKKIISYPAVRNTIDFNFIAATFNTRKTLKHFMKFYNPNLSRELYTTIFNIITVRRQALEQIQEQAQHNESSMKEREACTAEVNYELAKKLYEEEFQKRGLEAIEASLRKMLLEEILNSLEDVSDAAQINFIKTNEAHLVQGNNEALMQEARSYFSSPTNENHLAWRAYDRYAPVAEWTNPLTATCPPLDNPADFLDVPQPSEQDIYEMRHRVALYFLALITAKENETHLPFDVRKRIVIGQLAEIRQPPSHDKIVGIDNPSCPPGTKTRIAKMGAGHDILSITDPITEMRAIIQRLFTHYLNILYQKADRDTKEKIALSLESFSSENIPSMLNGKYQTIVDSDGNEHCINALALTYLSLIHGFLHHHGCELKNIDPLYALINQELNQRENPCVQPLELHEKTYIKEQILYLSHNGIANKIAMNLRPPPIQAEKINMPIVNCDDPFALDVLQTNLMQIKDSVSLSPNQKKLPIILLKKQIDDAHEKTALFNKIFKVLIEEEELKAIPEIIAYLTKESVNFIFEYGDKKTLNKIALDEAYAKFKNTADFQSIPFFEHNLDCLVQQLEKLQISDAHECEQEPDRRLYIA